MESKFCIRCGCKLSLTNLNVYYCPNCGKLIENQEVESTRGEISYVG